MSDVAHLERNWGENESGAKETKKTHTHNVKE